MQGRRNAALVMSLLFSALLFAGNAMAFSTVKAEDVSSTGNVFEATLIPDGNWQPPSVSFWARMTFVTPWNTYESWEPLSNTDSMTFLAENLGNNRYRMVANNIGFLSSDPNMYNSYNSLDTIVKNRGFWIGYDDPETPGTFPYYMVLRDGKCYDENDAWITPLDQAINPYSSKYPDWAFTGQSAPEPMSLLLLGTGLLGLGFTKGKKK